MSGEQAGVVRVVSSQPAVRWEDSLISGNGATGVMVKGHPLEETIVVNHEKLWVVAVNGKREVVDMRPAVAEARKLARAGKFVEAAELMMAHQTKINKAKYDPHDLLFERRMPVDRVHPGFHIQLRMDHGGGQKNYSREMVLDTGEVIVRWDDDRGACERRVFVSRPHDAIVLQLRKPADAKLNCTLWLAEAPGRHPGDIGEVAVEHSDDEVCFHAAYGRTAGREAPEGYHAFGRVICRGGSAGHIIGQGIRIDDADEVLVVLRLAYLDRADDIDASAFRAAVADLPDDYDTLLAAHAAVHGAMFGRVRLDLGGACGAGRATEEILERAAAEGPTPELLELLHAVGRYALICSSGDLPPTLMGIWGDDWDAPWDGRFTFDSNLNLAIAAGSQGDMPEAMDSYFRFIESLLPDWERNARRIHDCRGYCSDLTQGWRDGITMWGYYTWTGGAGWLSSYFYDHYLYTGDKTFLRDRALPLLKGVATFYEDFLAGTEGDDGRYFIYPTLSPENYPSNLPPGKQVQIMPNPASEIAICRQVLTNTIAACRELGVDDDGVARWEAMLPKLPDYRINEDGALAEWSHPDLKDRYNHRHNSHLYGVYPSLEIGPYKTPELFAAAERAIAKRLEAGRGDCSAHGLMHLAFFAARLKDTDLMWWALDQFSRCRYLNSSMIGSHNPRMKIYNLDATLAFPGVLTEMLVHSEPGLLHLLPGLPVENIPVGRIEGVLARGAIVVKSLAWDCPAGSIVVSLRSKGTQTITLRGPRPIEDLDVLGSAGGVRELPADRGVWEVDLPAGETVELRATLTGA